MSDYISRLDDKYKNVCEDNDRLKLENIELQVEINHLIKSDDDSEYTIMEIANKLIYLIKEENCVEKWITYIEDRPFNDKRYYISNQKLKDLGWKIKMDFDVGIKDLILHYKNKINTIL